MQLLESEKHIFDIYFIGIVSMAHCHPGTTREAGLNLSLEQCGDKALEMLRIRRGVFGMKAVDE